MPTELMKLTAIPGLCQGDTWTPNGEGGFPQIIYTDGDGDIKAAGYLVFVCEDEDNPPIFASSSAAVNFLNGLILRNKMGQQIIYQIKEEGNPIDATIKQALRLDDLIAQLTVLRAKWGNVPVVIGADPRDVDIDMRTASAVKAEGFWWFETEAVIISSPSFFDGEN